MVYSMVREHQHWLLLEASSQDLIVIDIDHTAACGTLAHSDVDPGSTHIIWVSIASGL
jgi:hypothetical protein